MPEFLHYAVLAFIIFATHFQEAVIGFGCTVLALPFVIFLLGLGLAVKVLVIQAWIVNGYIVLANRRNIVWRQYGRILIFAGVGLPVGMVVLASLPESVLKYVLGVFMVGVAARGLATIKAKRAETEPAASGPVQWLMNGILFLGGVIHGAFGSGGPLVVIYATRALRDKGIFRVTLCMVWLTLNTIMITKWFATRAISHEVWLYTAFSTPFTVVGMVIGNLCHHRINERTFRYLVFSVLFLAGLAVLYSAWRGQG